MSRSPLSPETAGEVDARISRSAVAISHPVPLGCNPWTSHQLGTAELGMQEHYRPNTAEFGIHQLLDRWVQLCIIEGPWLGPSATGA